ncbi:hypothetical protein TNIN_92131 [Trichonephila inaurata madagascariensis]|uniref:Uncharacterized protein n=1 Tax=Trichonephila inaurata madagascariensis TaxID=2747483 RepID=A0A8X6YVX3_9ARAC|nr:hypothetical protein TNIN_92131 [Trichonephila inaurata madagascariensis]
MLKSQEESCSILERAQLVKPLSGSEGEVNRRKLYVSVQNSRRICVSGKGGKFPLPAFGDRPAAELSLMFPFQLQYLQKVSALIGSGFPRSWDQP